MESARRWLGDTPVTDPVDRRNAPFVQVLLLFFCVFVPLNKSLYLWAVLSGRWHGRSMLAFDVATDLLMCVAAGVAVWMIRRGHFRRAVSLFLGTVLAAMVAIYAVIDVKNVAVEVFPLMVLALGGLVLGRRALWSIAALQVLGYAICLASNLLGFVPEKQPALVATGIIISTTGAYLLIAIIVDRTVAALREALAESIAKTNRLEREMAERERAQQQLVHAQKMEAVGRIASGVAHDFDNVLNVVLGYAMRRERLADRGAGALVGALEGVETAARRALAISRKLLNFSRQDSLRPEVFDVAALLRDIEPMLRQLFPAEVRLELQADAAGLPVRADRGQFELMLLNIAANARDAMPAGGRFAVRARRAAGAPAMELVLADDGSGMPAEVRERVFEPFYTTKPAGTGTGLGLAVVYDLVHAAGGQITVESAPGQGTAFLIRLPLAEDAAAESAMDLAGGHA
ncbi:hypothetical protein ASG87_00015 [Frateuria sp. Soil773]|nr:hypothetical protein ASG87_00015 [Frateuria sp. Soil773]